MSLPKHILYRYGGTTKSFKRIKRQQLRHVIGSFCILLAASDYTPSGAEVSEIKRLLDRMKRQLSVKSWGR